MLMDDTLNRAGELLQLQNYFRKREQQAAITSMEKMIITALQSNTPSEVIEAMRKNAEITETRLDELKKQAQITQS